jgi:hypothetical protein
MAIRKMKSEKEFQRFVDRHPEGGIANAFRGQAPYMHHTASCWTLRLQHHVEGQAATKYDKYAAPNWRVLFKRWPNAKLCAKCIGKGE